ncbi:MAG TPA: NfeD family protein [Myxococcota bacterium]|nr:NfeD family protein [Myxococcota bacterium]
MGAFMTLVMVALVVTLCAVVVGIWLISKAWPARTGAEGMAGKEGVAVGPIDRTGSVLLEGEYWKARAVQPIADGTPVVVTRVKGLVLIVQPSAENNN